MTSARNYSSLLITVLCAQTPYDETSSSVLSYLKVKSLGEDFVTRAGPSSVELIALMKETTMCPLPLQPCQDSLRRLSFIKAYAGPIQTLNLAMTLSYIFWPPELQEV